MKVYVFEREVVVARPLNEVFAFFAEPRNLARITPPWLSFEMTGWDASRRATAAGAEAVQEDETGGSGQPVMAQGLLLYYRVRPLIVPQRWTSEITEWDPPHRFTDEQLRGPYRLWRHAHTFDRTEAGTRVGDRVEYALPFGPIGRLAHLLLVRHQLERIFAFREAVIDRIFGTDPESESP